MVGGATHELIELSPYFSIERLYITLTDDRQRTWEEDLVLRDVIEVRIRIEPLIDTYMSAHLLMPTKEQPFGFGVFDLGRHAPRVELRFDTYRAGELLGTNAVMNTTILGKLSR